MPIYFRCKNCSEDHPSPIQVDRETFEDSTHNIIQNSSFQCPKTGQSALYSKKDTYWRYTGDIKI